MTSQKQGTLGNLLSQQDRFHDRRLATSFVEMAGALPCRPEPRALFDNAASPGRVDYYGRRLIVAADAVLSAAIGLRERDVLECTAKRVAHHVAELECRMLRQYTQIASGAVTLDEAADEAAEETARTSARIAHWAIRHDDAARDELLREIDAEMLRLAHLREALVVPRAALNDRPQLVRA